MRILVTVGALTLLDLCILEPEPAYDEEPPDREAVLGALTEIAQEHGFGFDPGEWEE